MNGILQKNLLRISIAVLVGTLTTVSAVAQGPLKEVLDRLEGNYKSLTTLKSAIKMDKFNSQLGEHDISEGNVTYIPQKGRDAAFRVDWTKPANESLSVINRRYVIYREKQGTAYTGSVDKASGKTPSGALAFMSMSKAQLNENYEKTYIGVETVGGSKQTFHLLLTPKTATSYKTADVWIDADGMPVQAKITENNNDTTTVLLTNIQKNVKVDASSIAIKPPKGTKIVQS